ncbi:MAG: hypothetical protein V7K53_04805 [Nostoc sp.]|uniref:hypothetical protein n=1 Tax=Nostoc sp. TaxID=1180 RepID=UPI002FF82D46
MVDSYQLTPFFQTRCRIPGSDFRVLRSLNYKNLLRAKQSLNVAIALEHHFFRLDVGFVFVCCDRLIIKTHCQQCNLRKERSLLNTIFSD